MTNAHLGAHTSCYFILFILHICSFTFGYFAHFSVFLHSVTARQKMCCNVMLLLENPDSLSLMVGEAVVPLVCSFIRRDNILAWRELFQNLYKLKSHMYPL